MRRCPDCGLLKPDEDFPRNRSARSGRGCYCKPCHNARNRATVLKKGGSRDYHLRQKYGVTAAQVAAMIAEQGGVCAVCKKRPPTQVDHDHSTGAVRGILCDGCNGGLGHFRDDPELIRRAIEYLKKQP